MAGDLDIDIAGTGVQPAALGRVLNDPALKANTDNPTLARSGTSRSTRRSQPLDNIHCRKAVMYATDQVGHQTAYGGPIAGGDIATTILPPNIPGYQKFDLYPTPGQQGRRRQGQGRARSSAASPTASRPTSPTATERPKEKATAEALQQSLAKVGIKADAQGYPQGDYFALLRRQPAYVEEEQPRPDRSTAGVPTGRRLRLPVADRGQPASSGRPVQHPTSSSRPRGRQAARQGASDEPTRPSARRSGAQIDKKVMEEAVHPPFVYAKSAAATARRPDERVRQPRLRHVRLPGHRRQVAASQR